MKPRAATLGLAIALFALPLCAGEQSIGPLDPGLGITWTATGFNDTSWHGDREHLAARFEVRP